MNQWFIVTQMQICLHQPTDMGERNSRNKKIKKDKKKYINILDILLWLNSVSWVQTKL